MLSDRSLARGGGRRRWVAGGAAATLASYAGLVAAEMPVAVVTAVVAFQVAVNWLLAPLLAIMADEVPDAQKGVAGGLLSLGAPAASAVSALLVASTLGEAGRLLAVPLVAAACVVPLLLSRAVPVADGPATRDAVPARDLATAIGARLMVQVAGNVLSVYLLYYFQSVAPGEPMLAVRTGQLLTVAYILPLPIALAAGRLSDRTGRRKPMLLAAALLAAAGLVGMAGAGSWQAGAIGLAAYAIGSTVFLALHAAFAMQLLPDPRHRGRDLGLLNLANTVPSLVGPGLTWWLATPRDFAPVMLTVAAMTLGGGVAMLTVRGRG
jgi:MFS family permease